jgi:hypothetical protein
MYNRDINDRIPETRPAIYVSVNMADERLSLFNVRFSERMNSRRISDTIRRSKSVNARCNRAEHVSRIV